MTVDDLRRLAEACRDLDDPVVMAKAWDDPHYTGEGIHAGDSMHETAPTMKRRHLQALLRQGQEVALHEARCEDDDGVRCLHCRE